VSTQPTMQGAKFRTLSKRALWAPGLAPALAALLAMLLTLGLGQMQTAQAQAQAILYVDTDATGATHDGLSWTTAYTTVQDALDVANADSGTVYEIWVAAGVYYPDEGGGRIDNDRGQSFRMTHDNVQIYGGFAGSEDTREQRDWAANVTVLSGDIDRNDMVDARGVVTSAAGIAGANAFHVLYLDGETGANITAATVIDGFTVTGGNASEYNQPSGYGGGLYCAGGGGGNACSPTLGNLVFSGNHARHNGGGMINRGQNGGVSSPALTNVTFSGNQAEFGGGMVNWGYAGVSSPTLTNVTFSGNRANTDGGGMVNAGDYGMSSPVLTNVTFSGNHAGRDGGGMANDGYSGVSRPVLVNVILWGNAATNGSQILNAYGAAPVLSYSLVQGGCPTGASCGAGMRYEDPLFVQPIGAIYAPTTTGNYRLQLDSPAIDAGNTLSVTAATDLDGNPRVINGIVDMGAYETANVFTLDIGTAGQGTADVQPQQDDYVYGTAVTLTAQADVGWTFAGWSGDLEGTANPATLTMTGNKAVTATFEAFTYMLYTSTVGQGAVLAQPQQDVYAHGTAVTLTAQAATGWLFLGWGGACSGLEPACPLTVDGDKHVAAAFVEVKPGMHALKVVKGGSGAGAVSSDPPGIDCGWYCAWLYEHDSVVTLSAAASPGSAFNGWSGACSGVGPCSVTLDAATTVTATFEILTYTLHIGTAGQGTVEIDPQRDVYAYGTAVTLTAQPAAGWTFAGWSGGLFAQAGLVPNPITLTIAENTSITATFEALTYTLSLAADPPQGGTVSGAGVYAHGAQAEAGAAPAPGWLFVEWRENGARVSGDALYRFTVTGDRALTAHFRETTGEETGQQPAPHRVLLPAVIRRAP